MTDENEISETEAPDLATSAQPSRPRPDALLRVIVDFVDGVGINEQGTGPSVGLTILTPAGPVSGELISRAEWVAASTTGLRESNDQFADFIQQVADKLAPSADNLPNFLHLKDARYVAGESVSIPAGIVRVRLADVIGWSYSSFNVENE